MKKTFVLSRWTKTVFGSFFATVLGIAVTFGIDKMISIQKSHELRRQAVYSVLADLDNLNKFLRQDSAYCDYFDEWLPRYMDAYASNKNFSADTAFAYFYFAVEDPAYTRYRPKMVGCDIIQNIPISDETDLQINRAIRLTYDYIDQIRVFEAHLDEFLDEIMNISNYIKYSATLFSVDECAKMFFDSKIIREFGCTIKRMKEGDGFGQFQESLNVFRNKFIKVSGVTEEDYLLYVQGTKKRLGTERK